jgi:hypothetical protein
MLRVRVWWLRVWSSIDMSSYMCMPQLSCPIFLTPLRSRSQPHDLSSCGCLLLTLNISWIGFRELNSVVEVDLSGALLVSSPGSSSLLYRIR